MRKRPQEGFTLIELLVVVAIIGILASVVMVTVANARSKAKNSAIMQSVKSFQKLLLQEYADNGSYANLQNIELGPQYVMTFFTAEECDTGFTASVYVTEARAICKQITSYERHFTVGHFGGPDPTHQKYSISTYLYTPPKDFLGNPYDYCVGSSGEGMYSPMGNGNQTQKGCFNNP